MGCYLLLFIIGGSATQAAEKALVPEPEVEFSFPLYLGQLANGRELMLFMHFDKKGLAEAQFVPTRLSQGQFVALPPEERASGLAEIVARFPQLENSAWRAEALFWNGTSWQIAPTLAYIREATPEGSVHLPEARTIQVRDLSGESGGFSTGKAIADFAKEPQTDQRIELNAGKLKIWRPNSTGDWQVVWESKPSWQVLQFDFGDADEDGRPELIFSLWKDDGPDDEGQFRSHPFVYGWRRGTIRPVWAGSALVDPIREFALGNFAQSGPANNQLIVLEGHYSDTRTNPA
ncbi:MAG: VCBS repeat-containing protein, partial [Chloroflexota bacterium]